MYKVIVRKSLRFADGSAACEESEEQVNHELHALNLAAKIARSEVVEWVEIEELKGRFKARASRAPDGTVQESLQSRHYNIHRKARFYARSKIRIRRVVVVLGSLLGLGILGYITGISHRWELSTTAPRSKGGSENAANRQGHSVRLGDLQLTATSVGALSPDLGRRYQLPSRSGYHLVMVSLKVENVGQSAGCIAFYPWMRVNSGYKYQPPNIKKLRAAKTYRLPPNEESHDNYVFEVKDGVAPVILELAPEAAGEYRCQQGPQPGRRVPHTRAIELSLEGLPNYVEKRNN